MVGATADEVDAAPDKLEEEVRMFWS